MPSIKHRGILFLAGCYKEFHEGFVIPSGLLELDSLHLFLETASRHLGLVGDVVLDG